MVTLCINSLMIRNPVCPGPGCGDPACPNYIVGLTKEYIKNHLVNTHTSLWDLDPKVRVWLTSNVKDPFWIQPGLPSQYGPSPITTTSIVFTSKSEAMLFKLTWL